MRLIPFTYLRSYKFKPLYYQIVRYYSSDKVQPKIINEEKFAGDPSLVEILPSWPVGEEEHLRTVVVHDMRVLPDFISEREEAGLLDELEPYLKRMRYEFDHWDNAIQGYRETERGVWREHNESVLARVRAAAFRDAAAGAPLPHAHVLDLAAAGFIKPHVDAVRFCGDVIAGLCLCSSAVMRLRHTARPHLAFDALLARRCLYIMRGAARYEFTHAVAGGAEGAEGAGARWRGAPLARARRVAVILRSRPRRADAPAPAAAAASAPTVDPAPAAGAGAD